MKFFGSFIVLALINLVTVFAGPPPNVYKKDSTFEYWLSSGNAYIMDVVNSGLSSVTIPPYVTFDGVRYPVTQLLNVYTNTNNLKTITVNNNFDHDFTFSNFGLQKVKSLRNIVVNSKRVKAIDDAFAGLSDNLNIYGSGVSNMMASYAKSWLFYHNIDSIVLNSTTPLYKRQNKLYEVARAVAREFSYYSNIAYPNNGAVTLALKKGGSLGIARAFRILAMAAGFDYNDIHVISDNKYYSWNTVKFDNRWYNYDILYNPNMTYDDATFNTRVLKPKYGSLTNTSNWIIYIGQYGYSGESPSGSENFTNWLIRNRLGFRTN